MPASAPTWRCSSTTTTRSANTPTARRAGLPDTHVGTLTEALMTEATDDGWAVVSMKNDWNQIFP